MPSGEIPALSVRITASEEEKAGSREETAAAANGPSDKPAEPDAVKFNMDKADRGEETSPKSQSLLEYFYPSVCPYLGIQ